MYPRRINLILVGNNILSVIMDSALILDYLNKMLVEEEIENINARAGELISLLKNTLSDEKDIFNDAGESYQFVINDLKQINDVRTIERKKYYLNRLVKSLTEVKTGKINDLNMNRWKEYEDLRTDSLWIFSKRDRSGTHSGKYWGNFIPQIPNQLLRRYTKQGDWVLDPFCGSGTTLIECKKLGRNCLGIDISQDALDEIGEKVINQNAPLETTIDIYRDNSIEYNYEEYLCSKGIKAFQFAILHPPYWDIIKFSDDPDDLSNCSTPEDYLRLIGELTDKIYDYIEDERYVALVIGDKYNKGEWVPLGFYAMDELLKRKFKLKSVIVKNFDETKGKMQQKELWRYRALAGGFYIFKHEYIFLFQKQKSASVKKLVKQVSDVQPQTN